MKSLRRPAVSDTQDDKLERARPKGTRSFLELCGALAVQGIVVMDVGVDQDGLFVRIHDWRGGGIMSKLRHASSAGECLLAFYAESCNHP